MLRFMKFFNYSSIQQFYDYYFKLIVLLNINKKDRTLASQNYKHDRNITSDTKQLTELKYDLLNP